MYTFAATSHGILAVAAAATVGLYVYRQRKNSNTMSALDSATKKREQALQAFSGVPFDLQGKAIENMNILTDAEATAVLREHEQEFIQETAGKLINLRIYTNQVASNSPIEDYIAWMPLRANDGEGIDYKPKKFMFGIYDGHAGHMCAEQLQKRLGFKLDEALGLVGGNPDNYIDESSKALVETINQLNDDSKEKWDPMSLALTAAFANMDNELVFDVLKKYQSASSPENVKKLLRPAMDGSCGIVAVLDTEANELTVGNAGDSRAILGYRKQNKTWGSIELSTDQNVCMNHQEVMRLVREHPDEALVIRNGRVLGGLMVSRAFGDCKYKWPMHVQKEVFPELRAQGYKHTDYLRNYISPPYITAKPDIRKHTLDGREKFLVVFSDGISDEMSSDAVARVVGQWYDATIANARGKQQSKVMVEKNAATHVIRTALSLDRLSRIDNSLFRSLLTIPTPHSRDRRDDISVAVVIFDNDRTTHAGEKAN